MSKLSRASKRRGTIEVNYLQCTGCRLCESACSLFHEGRIWPEASRIRVEQFYPGPLDIPIICHRCMERHCVHACPTDALVHDAAADIVRLNADACIQCDACYSACPHTGAVAPHPMTRLPMQCDLCDGSPRCTQACPTGCIQWVQGSGFDPSHYVIPPELIARSLALAYYPAKEVS